MLLAFFIGQGVNVEEVSSDCLSATEVYHPETPSSVQFYQVLNTHKHTQKCISIITAPYKYYTPVKKYDTSSQIIKGSIIVLKSHVL